jgi:hypothetical protein
MSDLSAKADAVDLALTAAPARQLLSRDACLALLAPGGRGRIAATRRAVPIILMVTFELRADDIVFTTCSDAGLARAVDGAVIAFETDEVQADGHVVWEVQVAGVATSTTITTTEPALVSGPAFHLSSEIMTGWHAGT